MVLSKEVGDVETKMRKLWQEYEIRDMRKQENLSALNLHLLASNHHESYFQEGYSLHNSNNWNQSRMPSLILNSKNMLYLAGGSTKRDYFSPFIFFSPPKGEKTTYN